MTEPTDAEIFVVAREAGLLPDNSHPAPETRAARKHSNAVQAFARAVLAKWGTPPAVAGEDRLRAAAIELRDAPDLRAMQRATAKLYAAIDTTPQPTQAQAGAVPLTDEQIKDEASHHGFIGSTDQLVKFVRGIEAAHGIRGGQHGAP